MLSVSNLVRGAYGIQDVYLSLPAVIGRRGVERILQLDLSPDEERGLRHSAEVLHSAIEAVREVWAPRPAWIR